MSRAQVFAGWLARRAGLLAVVIVALAVLLALTGCDRHRESEPAGDCAGFERLPGATCSAEPSPLPSPAPLGHS